MNRLLPNGLISPSRKRRLACLLYESMLLFGVAMVAIMLYRPAGLWPSRRRQQELSHDE